MFIRIIRTFNRIMIHILDIVVFCIVTIQRKMFGVRTRPTKGIRDHIVYIKLDALGDFVLWLSTLPEPVKACSSSKVTLIIDRNYAALVENLNIYDELILINVDEFSRFSTYRFLKLLQLSKIKCNTALQCVYSRRSIICDSIMLMLLSDCKVTLSRDYKNNRITKFEGFILDRIYDKIYPLPSGPINELKLNRYLTGKVTNCTRFYAPNFNHLPSYFKSTKHDYYIVVAPFAGWRSRQWPMDRYLEVINWLFKAGFRKIIMVGTLSDRVEFENIPAFYREMIIDFVGKTSVVEYVSLIRDAEFVLCNDSSAAHIALATNTKMVCILGGGHFGRFLPTEKEVNKPVHYCFKKMPCFGCDWKCQYQVSNSYPVPCISAVEIQPVRSAINQIIGKHDAN